MLTAGEYFAKVYRSVPKPIIVCNGARQVVYSSSAAAPYMGKELPEQLLREAEACISTGYGSSLSLTWYDRTRVIYFTPAQFEGEVFAVMEIAMLTDYPELPELMVALTNAQGKLSVYLDSIYFVAQQLGFSDRYGKDLGQEVRRILRAANHLDRLLDIGDRATYRVPMDIGRFAVTFVQAVNDLEIRGSLAAETSGEKLYARIMPEDLELALGTLVSNAFRFGAAHVVVRASGAGEKVRITVADDGPGVAEPERVFDCGYRTRDKLGGEGLGISLAMVRHMLTTQDATLQYERVEDESRFHIEMDAAVLPEGIRLSDWKPEPLNNSLSQLRVELSDYMIAMDFEE